MKKLLFALLLPLTVCAVGNGPYPTPGGGSSGISSNYTGAVTLTNSANVFGGDRVSVSTASGIAVSGSSSTDVGISGFSSADDGVRGDSTAGAGVYGYSIANVGVYGNSTADAGVAGNSIANVGVYGNSTADAGVAGNSSAFAGVYGQSTADAGVYGSSSAANRYGIYSAGNSFTTLTNFSGYFVGDGSGLTNLQSTNLVGILPMGTLTSTVVTNGFLTTDGTTRSYSRNGQYLTNVTASAGVSVSTASTTNSQTASNISLTGAGVNATIAGVTLTNNSIRLSGTVGGVANYVDYSNGSLHRFYVNGEEMRIGDNAVNVYGTLTASDAYSGTAGTFSTTLTVSNGVATYGSNTLAPSSITFPASNANWTNTLGKNIFVFIDNAGVTGTVIKINGTQIASTLMTTGVATIPLQPNEFFSETYTIGTPTAKWKPQ